MNYDDQDDYTGAVPADFDFYDVGELEAKSVLALKLNALIASRGLSDEDAAALAEMARPVVTPEQRERLRNVSLDQLMLTLAAFGQHVEIVVRAAGESGPAGITATV
ncbi:XRE family transcriptional regulator [Burkholderia sp. AU18528]|uniref:XRE family transcriptional regulator n=1 Tax=Burkholderia anthinoferrum TaxID=3090833 RepID=A0ABU5WY65_9BURK|nr:MULTISPECIES: XRE family transcriptional regulator [Burkholderia]MEB2507873.1 XRE family transcriptional regulator [Burkholderia anthinoferrum]MEB2536119.1 XRE family transcriptional regulator [Burkholderia anthinoferrum]MEB2562655.1 XRE family transcriptional regulator [Burkholderia anthinoferrum]MEB2583943.1 XRE family transcriptional regulator [Burkholderia anthinoferrum]KVH09592.1 DNA-binding protein [Burkholderia anthina]